LAHKIKKKKYMKLKSEPLSSSDQGKNSKESLEEWVALGEKRRRRGWEVEGETWKDLVLLLNEKGGLEEGEMMELLNGGEENLNLNRVEVSAIEESEREKLWKCEKNWEMEWATRIYISNSWIINLVMPPLRTPILFEVVIHAISSTSIILLRLSDFLKDHMHVFITLIFQFNFVKKILPFFFYQDFLRIYKKENKF